MCVSAELVECGSGWHVQLEMCLECLVRDKRWKVCKTFFGKREAKVCSRGWDEADKVIAIFKIVVEDGVVNPAVGAGG
jgi:hypothetical protein